MSWSWSVIVQTRTTSGDEEMEVEVTWLCWASHQLGSGGRGCVTRDSGSVTLCNYVALCTVTMCWSRCFLLQSPIMFPAT